MKRSPNFRPISDWYNSEESQSIVAITHPLHFPSHTSNSMWSADEENRSSATLTDSVSWENSEYVAEQFTQVSSVFQSSTSASATSSICQGFCGALAACGGQYAFRRQDQPEAQQQSSADIVRPEEPIRNGLRSTGHIPPTPTTTTPPMMWGHIRQDDVHVGLVTRTCELFEIDWLSYHYDMLTEEHAPFSPPSQPQTSQKFFAFPNNNNDFVFQIMRRNTRNLVLDSMYPEVVPHIVITPSENRWDAYTIISQNRINVQCATSLTAPRCYLSPLARIPLSANEVYPEGFHETHDGIPPQRPKAVFSPSKFTQSVECSANERLIMYHVITALQRHQCKALAFLTSDVAKLFRRRYDCPDFVQSLEKPFKWTDPAEPLLANAYRPGNTVIDSICPMIAPHIIITEPPLEDPWISWNNATKDPQDCGFGNYLVVPSRLVSYINVCPDEDDAGAFEELTDTDECVSPADTPAPGTPVLGSYENNADILTCYTGHGTPEDSSEDLGELDPAYRQELDDITSCTITRPSCDIFAYEEDSDEEDGLPPFDDWYLSIVERTARLAVF